MEEKEFMLVSNNKIYMCKGIEELKPKIKALNAFDIAYRVYYLCQEEWTEMLVSPTEFLLTLDKV